MALHFLQSAPYGAIFGATPELAHALTTMVLDRGTVFVAVDSNGLIVGMLGAVAGPWLGVGPVCASEIAWWIEPDHRGGMTAIRLEQAYTEWARTQGAVVAQMIAPDDRTEQLYRKLRYRFIESAFIKDLAA